MRCAAATIPERRGTSRKVRGTACACMAVAALVCAAPAIGGPWALEDGSVFLSVTLSAEDQRAALMAGQFDSDPAFSAYGELGLGQGFTAGLELDWGTSSEMGTVFMRYTLSEPSAAVQFAIDGGVAGRSVDGQADETLFRLGASLGSSFGTGPDAPFGMAMMRGGGWLAVDGAAFLDDDGTLSIWRTEATLGVHLSDRLRAIFALKAEEYPQSPVLVTARPSVVLSMGEGTSVQAGLFAGLSGSDAVGLSLSLWRDF
jgi:hypothetical protein